MEFSTYGYGPEGRPLKGPWDVRPVVRMALAMMCLLGIIISKNRREFEKVKDGYSGAPVYDQRSGLVVALITHRQGADKGFAVDISNLARVYPGAREAGLLEQSVRLTIRVGRNR